MKNIILRGRPHVGGITYDPEHDLLWVCGRKKARAQLFAIKLTTIGQYPCRSAAKADSIPIFNVVEVDHPGFTC
ncbi:hypothetical protein LCUFL03_80026 [Latilactobacillus curvatus]|nr:hypothetical protein LCUFL03_80026 [Latilactobacillus curvatus]